MIEALIYVFGLVLTTLVLVGGSGLIVRTVEHGKLNRLQETERTKRAAFDAAYTAESNRQLELTIKAGEMDLATPPPPNPEKIEWQVPR